MEGTLEEAVNSWHDMGQLGSVFHVLACKYVVASTLQILNDLNIVGHTGHRDIKPDNVLIDRRRSIRVIDFGISRAFEPTREDLTATRVGAGSVGFAAP